MSDLSQIKTVAGEYSGFADTELRSHSGDFYTTANESGFITGVDLSPYQLTANMTAYQPVGEYLTTSDSAEFMTTAERSDYIPTGVSSEFYTTANESGYITGIPDTYLQNTDLSTADGKITAISGVPLNVMLSGTNDANVNNIILTASLPAAPDANTLYLIPET